MRVCSICKKERQLEEYYKNNRSSDGFSRHCKNCHKEMETKWEKNHLLMARARRKRAAATYRQRHPEKILERRKIWYALNKNKIKQAKAERWFKLKNKVIKYYGGKCVCCGEVNMKFLCMDHINNDGAKWRKENSGPLINWVIKNNFPADLRLLCFNCNLGRAFNNGICPHQEARVVLD